ncbi:MAG: methionyl-tRNA formyltransferase [Crocinitomicaceae bacterium]|nr:methionyl-tRNA formyltransferase [Crocinitomicaceae bacterium]
MTKDNSIVFMGTPEFAVEILKHLHINGVRIKGVITAPDKPAGRGRKINQSAVKSYAVEQNLNILQPTNLKDPEFIQELQNLNADLFVVVAFRMLPEVVWNMPIKGTINLHASLLPNYRGAAPINWAIINGESVTGVTTFFIEKEIDTGKIIDQEKLEIGEDENIGSLYSRLMKLGSTVMLKTVRTIFENDIKGIAQNEFMNSKRLPAPKIFKNDCLINFNRSAFDVHNFIRGLSPYPGAWLKVKDLKKGEIKTMKLYSSHTSSINSVNDNKIIMGEDGLLFPCQDYYIIIDQIQAEGKRKMSFKDYIAGNSIENLVIYRES